MRTTILLCSLMLAARCEPASAQTKTTSPAKKKSKAGKSKDSGAGKRLPLSSVMIEPDSPITIEDGNSIHFYKDNDWVIQGDGTMAETAIDPSVQYAFAVTGCNGSGDPPGCTVTSVTLPQAGPWYIALLSKAGKRVALLS